MWDSTWQVSRAQATRAVSWGEILKSCVAVEGPSWPRSGSKCIVEAAPGCARWAMVGREASTLQLLFWPWPCRCSQWLQYPSTWEPNSMGDLNLQHWCLQALRYWCVALPQQTGKLFCFLLLVEAAEEPSQVNQKNPTILRSLGLDVWFSKHFLSHFPSRTNLTSMHYLIYLPLKVRGLSLQFLCALWFPCDQIPLLLRTQVDGPFGESCTRA